MRNREAGRAVNFENFRMKLSASDNLHPQVFLPSFPFYCYIFTDTYFMLQTLMAELRLEPYSELMGHCCFLLIDFLIQFQKVEPLFYLDCACIVGIYMEYIL